MQPQQPYQPPTQPQQPAPTPAPVGPQTGYDFIMNPETAPKKTPFGGGNSLAMRLLVILGIVFIVMILLAVILSAVGGSSKKFDKTAMLGIAQDQTELLRLAGAGTEGAVTQSLKNFAATATLSLTTDQANFTSYINANGFAPEEEKLGMKHFVATDTQLANATSASNFEPVYRTVMDKQLATYQADLTAAYNTADEKGNPVLKSSYDSAALLRTQLTQQ